jgi:cystathionine beta-lyase/cystathionine gamma-synthase
MTGSITPPIYQTSTYKQTTPGENQGYEYARTQNPTREALEARIASLENCSHGICFSSGLGAATAVLQSLKAGDHVLCSDDLYGGSVRLFEEVFKKLGIEFTYVDFSNVEEVKEGFQKNTELLWAESPTNPMMKIFPMEEVIEAAKSKGASVLMDNTFASPYFQNPADFGCDIILHSSTKYINGHSDVLGGAIATNHQQWAEKIRFQQKASGAIPGPIDCFLVLRSLKTLHVRMERHQQNAFAMAEFLEGHKAVKRVLYPGLESHPQHRIAKSQMRGFGGVISFELKDVDKESMNRFFQGFEVASLAESLGGVDTLFSQPATMTHAYLPEEKRQALGMTQFLIRVSVGIENVDDLKEDFNRALALL